MAFDDLLGVMDGAVLGELGRSVVFTPTVGAPVTVRGVFTAPHAQVDPEAAGAGVSTVSPTVFLRLADLPSDPGTDTEATVEVSGATYRWHDSQPDGMGGVLLLLHLVA